MYWKNDETPNKWTNLPDKSLEEEEYEQCDKDVATLQVQHKASPWLKTTQNYRFWNNTVVKKLMTDWFEKRK